MLKAGKIEFGSSAIDCIVRNLSETGAALEIESPIGVPERFELFVPQDRSRRPADVVWRKERRIGIRFD
jgi:PilZ domain-containing protein